MSPKIHVYPEPWNVTLFKKQILRSDHPGFKMGSKSNDEYVYEMMRGHWEAHREHCETGDGLQSCIYITVSAKDSW